MNKRINGHSLSLCSRAAGRTARSPSRICWRGSNEIIAAPRQDRCSRFLFAILCGTALLSLPIAHASGETGPLLTAFFTAVSAVCVTGLVVVDTGTYWSTFGGRDHGAVPARWLRHDDPGDLLGLLVNRSFRLRAKLIAQAESHVLGLGDISSVAKLVLVVTLVMELAVMLLLTLRLHLSYGLGWGEAAWAVCSMPYRRSTMPASPSTSMALCATPPMDSSCCR